MAEQSAIEWCDSTFNPWIGCTAISPACDHCYAEAMMSTRMGRVEWGAGKPRSLTSEAYWRQPVRWNAKPFWECSACGWRGESLDCVDCPSCRAPSGLSPARRRVFCASLSDWLDNEVPIEWFVYLLDLIHRTPNLDWLMLSKRIGNWRSRMNAAIAYIEALPDWPGEDSRRGHHLEPLRNWLADWLVLCKAPFNVWLGATVCNQTESDRDIPKLLTVPARVRFLSIEPMLGPIDLTDIVVRHRGGTEDHFSALYDPDDDEAETASYIDWVICGGESGPHARPMHPDWVRSLRDQCAAAGVPFLLKQWASGFHPTSSTVVLYL